MHCWATRWHHLFVSRAVQSPVSQSLVICSICGWESFNYSSIMGDEVTKIRQTMFSDGQSGCGCKSVVASTAASEEMREAATGSWQSLLFIHCFPSRWSLVEIILLRCFIFAFSHALPSCSTILGLSHSIHFSLSLAPLHRHFCLLFHLPRSLCPQALPANWVVWQINEAPLIQ